MPHSQCPYAYMDNKIFGIEQKTKFKVELCTNDEHLYIQMYTFLSKFEMEEVKDSMKKWAKN